MCFPLRLERRRSKKQIAKINEPVFLEKVKQEGIIRFWNKAHVTMPPQVESLGS
jgi:hypothetical protein